MYGNGTGAWTNSEFGMIHLLYFTYLTQCFVKQLVHSLFFYNLFSVSPSWCFVFFPFWYCLCHYHSLFLCSWHVFHIYFSYSETFLSYILVLYTRIKMFPHPGGSLYSCHCRDQEAACGLPYQITSAMWGFFLIRHLCPLICYNLPAYTFSFTFTWPCLLSCSMILQWLPLLTSLTLCTHLYSVFSHIPITCYGTILAHYDIYLLLSNQDMILCMNFLKLQLTSPWVQYYINDAVGIITLKVAAGTPTDLAQTSHLLLFVTVVQSICCIHWCCNLWCNDTVMIIMCTYAYCCNWGHD